MQSSRTLAEALEFGLKYQQWLSEATRMTLSDDNDQIYLRPEQRRRPAAGEHAKYRSRALGDFAFQSLDSARPPDTAENSDRTRAHCTA